MAKNWTMKEALEAIATNDKEGMQDLGRRFPLTAIALGKGDMTTIINALPDHITARKIESVLKDGIAESTDEDVEDTEDEIAEEKPAKKEKKVAKEKVEKPAKKAKKEEPMNEPEEDDEDETVDDYSEMSAVDLFKLCKKRGIKAEPKKKAADYIKLLKADDNNNSENNDDEDDWDI